ncbi:hypothetical protein [Curtobacterium sp. PhB136]|nr:hypothetical protein [Curtobacterium sp. PhB136]TCK64126.1 hypothetical protein EDF27_1368 [Curtobacterium sp. PhB136]
MTATQPTTTTTNTAAALGRPGAAGDDRRHGFRRGWVGTLVTHV